MDVTDNLASPQLSTSALFPNFGNHKIMFYWFEIVTRTDFAWVTFFLKHLMQSPTPSYLMLKIGLYGQVSCINPFLLWQCKSLQNTGTTDQLCMLLCASAKCWKALHDKQMWPLESWLWINHELEMHVQNFAEITKKINKRIRRQEYSSINFVDQLKTAILS